MPSVRFVSRWLARTLVALAVSTFSIVGCGSSSGDSIAAASKPYACCAIKSACSHCQCSQSSSSLQSIGNAGDEDACRLVLEKENVGCGSWGLEDAVSSCAQ
jgi:hypothetical protein